MFTVTMPVSVVVATMPVIFAVLAPVPVTALVIIMPMRFIMGDIYLVIPVIMDEIDRPVAGIIPGAVLAPVFRVSGRDMQIERLLDDMDGSGPDYHGFGVDQGRPGGVADVNLAVKTGLAHCH